MRYLILIFIFFLTSICFSQDYFQIDSKVKNYPEFSSLTNLSIRIKNDFDSNSERVRAAFTWIVSNIKYDESLDTFFAPKPNLVYLTERGRNNQIQKNSGKRITKAFRSKKGTCIEYSLLLHELCLDFGVGSLIIKGIAKTEIRNFKGEQLFKNHSWNVVKLDGEWKFIDTTWASAYISPTSKEIVRENAEHYFFTSPSVLIKTHFPADADWQLLTPLVDVGSFFKAPIFFPGYFTKGIILASNTDGLLRLSDDNEFHIRFKKLPNKSNMSFWVSETSELKKMRLKKTGKNEYIVESKLTKKSLEKEDLVLIWDNEPILAFKIQKDNSLSNIE